VEAILHRAGQQRAIPGRAGEDPLRDPSEIENGVLSCGAARHEAPSFVGGGQLARDEEHGSPTRWPIEAMHPDAAIAHCGDAKPTVEGGGQVVAVPLEGKSQLENPLRRHSKTAEARPEDDARHDRGRAATEASADGDIVFHSELEAVEGPAPAAERLLGGSHQQVPAVEWHLFSALSRPGDRGLRRFARLNREAEVQGQGEDIEARSEVGRRCRDPHRGAFRHGYSLNAS